MAANGNGKPAGIHLLHQLFHMGHIDRITDKQQFVDRVGNLGGQVRHTVNRDVVDLGFNRNIGVVRLLGHNAFFIVSQRNNIPVPRVGADRFNKIRRKCMLHKRFPGGAVNHFAAIVAQNAAAVPCQA